MNSRLLRIARTPLAYDVGWEHRAAGVGQAVTWQVMLGHQVDEGMLLAYQQEQLAVEWETYAEAVTSAVRRVEGVQPPEDAAAGDFVTLLTELNQSFVRPVIVETHHNGQQVATTTLRWGGGLTNRWEEITDEQNELITIHQTMVDAISRIVLAMMQRDMAIAGAVRHLQTRRQLSLSVAWQSTQQAANIIRQPALSDFTFARQLLSDAIRWEADKKNGALLYNPLQLVEPVKWVTQNQTVTLPIITAFIEASQVLWQRQQRGRNIPFVIQDETLLNFEWCWVPAGAFNMGELVDGGVGGFLRRIVGNERTEGWRVNVDEFWMSRHPVTNAQFGRFIEAGGYADEQWWTKEGWQMCKRSGWREPRYWHDKEWNGAQQPVVGVSWYEAMAFCAWASSVTGQRIYLPTEAEWEKAARGTDGREYPWGNQKPTADLCNFNDTVGRTISVGQYSPQGDSPHGCTDMAGNVWEWCLSQYKAYPYQTEDGRNTPEGEDWRVLRGGSWDYSDNLRAAYRNWDDPFNGFDCVGFRCASTPF